MTIDEAVPLACHIDVIPEEWIDENDHLHTMHYKSVANFGLRKLLGLVGLEKERRRAQNKTIFQLEMHICYERELRRGKGIEINSWLIAADRKRIHSIHEIFDIDKSFRAATVELMSLYVDVETRRATSFSDDTQRRLDALAAAYEGLTLPDKVGGRISMIRS